MFGPPSVDSLAMNEGQAVLVTYLSPGSIIAQCYRHRDAVLAAGLLGQAPGPALAVVPHSEQEDGVLQRTERGEREQPVILDAVAEQEWVGSQQQHQHHHRYHVVVQVSVHVLAGVEARAGVVAAPRVGRYPGSRGMSGPIESCRCGDAQPSAGLGQIHEGQLGTGGHSSVLAH